MARSVQEMWSDLKRFFDWWNLVGLVAVLGLIGYRIIDSVSPFSISLGTQDGILILTGVYAFTAFNQMRETRWTRRQGEGMALRPHFVDGSDGADLTLQNFGEGAALDLRLWVVLRSSEGIEQFELVSKEDAVHLAEGDYFPVTCGGLAGLNDPDSKFYRDPSATLEFYYTWEATTGRQYPSGIEESGTKPMEDIIEVSDSPRTVRVSEVRERLN